MCALNTFSSIKPSRQNARVKALKGQCHEIFNFWFFSWISFPQAPEYTIKFVSNFFENSWIYEQLKVHHRCRCHRWLMEEIFNHKSFKYFIWTPLGSTVELTYRYIFAFKFTLRSHQPDIVPIICRRCRWFWRQIATGVVDSGGKFAAGTIDTGVKFATGINNTSETGGKICRRCRLYQWQTLWHCPFKGIVMWEIRRVYIGMNWTVPNSHKLVDVFLVNWKSPCSLNWKKLVSAIRDKKGGRLFWGGVRCTYSTV